MSTKLKKRFVYIEDELWKLLKKISLIKGCSSHPDAGSSSEAARRMIKLGLITNEKQLLNYEKDKIDWDERYK